MGAGDSHDFHGHLVVVVDNFVAAKIEKPKKNQISGIFKKRLKGKE